MIIIELISIRQNPIIILVLSLGLESVWQVNQVFLRGHIIRDSGNCQVISAPTGSGKTVVLELAILRLLSVNIDLKGGFVHDIGKLKVVYIGPTKSLVQEKVSASSSVLTFFIVFAERQTNSNVN